MAASDTAFVRTYIAPGHQDYPTLNSDRAHVRTFTVVAHPDYPTLNSDRAYVRTYIVPGSLIPPMVGALPIYRA